MPRLIATILWFLAVLATTSAMAAIVWTLLIRDGQTDWLAINARPGAELGLIADEIRPVLAVIAEFHAEHGVYPLAPTDIADRLPVHVLADRIGDTISLDVGQGHVWLYARAPDGQGFEAIRKLAPDGSLTRIQIGSEASWLHAADENDEPVAVSLPP